MISIVIPTLNEEKVIEKTLLSLRRLRAYDYEIIVSDGKSTDKTVAIAKKYADKVVEYKDEARQTISGGRNAGAAVAKGEYLVFLDADVRIPDIDGFFRKILEYFDSHEKAVATVVFLKVFPKDATLSDMFFFTIINLVHYFSNNFLRIGSASGEFQMIRADAFKKVNGYNEKFVAAEDGDMFSRLAKVGRTRSFAGLHVLHTSRRAHKTGWTPLLISYLANAFYTKVFKKAFSREWKVIR
ncbi:MAG: glycosyltransferase [Candidatus Pacebacteria bacterium]|nr:glycosyltransferase [Candidatus Paceibacterota bacterium]